MIGIALAAILVLGVSAQWLAWRLRIPSILLLLLTGLLVGPVALWFNQSILGRSVESAVFLDVNGIFGRDLLLALVSVAVGLILFEGGLTLNFSEIRQVRTAVLSLVTIGAGITWLIASLAGHYILGLNWPVATLLGAILVVTGPTVIGPLLRFVRPIGSVGKVLKWEGIVIDPIGALLAVLVFEAIRTGQPAAGLQERLDLALTFAINALKVSLIGSGIGLGAAAILVVMLRRFMIPDHLQVPATVAMVLAAFSASNLFVHESGLFATTIMGIALANQRQARISHIHEFKETLTILLIAMLFIVLAARLQLDQLTALWEHRWGALGFLAVLIFIARPASVLLSTLGTKLNLRQKLFLSWMAPRGIVAASVASVFGIALVGDGVPQAQLLTPYVFLTIIVTVALYGLSAVSVATRLGVANPANAGFLVLGANPVGRALASALQDEKIELLVVDTNLRSIREARSLGLPTLTANILSPVVLEQIELTGIGRLMALTPNNEINSLAAVHFARYFGRSNIYQLAYSKEQQRGSNHEGTRRADGDAGVSGRTLFGKQYTYDFLVGCLGGGGKISRTKLTREFTYEHWMRQFAKDRVPLLVLDETGALQVLTEDRAVTPRSGQTIIWLSIPASIAQNRERSEQRVANELPGRPAADVESEAAVKV